MRNVLVVIASLVIVLLGALAAAPYVIDWDGWRGNLEEEATRLLGRDVRVGGTVRISFLPAPTFAIENVRIADLEANSGEPLFRAEAVTGTLAITPLFRGILQANEIILRRPRLHIVLDADGGGNWTTLGQGGQLPFTLTSVALDSVRIEGGQLSVYGSDRLERLQIDTIDGDLSVAAVDGPFRFRGTYGPDGARREVRFAAAKQEPDGSVRFKASLKQLDSNALYNFDARAIDLARAPRFEGELSAFVPLPQAPGVTVPAGEAPVEIKAALSAGARAVKLSNLSVAFERQGRPQILTGAAEIALTAPVTVEVALSAKWLDLDQIIGAVPGPAPAAPPTGTAEGPVGDLLRLATRLNGLTPEAGRTQLALDVEQATLGREPVSGLRLRLAGQGAETDIQDLRLGLPGGARADVKGLMTGTGEETAFDGSVVLRGGSLARFLSWGSVGGIVLDPARDGPFAVRARLVAAPGSVQARDFVGDVSGTTVQGELGYRWRGRPEVSVLIEGPQVDLRPVLPAGGDQATPASVFGTLRAATAAHPMASGLDGVLRIRTGQLVLPNARYRDVAMDVAWRDQRIRLDQVTFAAGNGVAVDLRGDLPTDGAQKPGALAGTVTATDVAGVRLLADILSLPRDLLPPDRVLAELTPVRLAGRATFGDGPQAGFAVEADGELGDSRLRGRAALSGGLTQWRTAPIDISAALGGPRAAALVAAVTGGDGMRSGDAQRARLTVDGVGVPAEGWTGRVVYSEGTGKIALNGRGRDTGVDQPIAFDGDVTIEAADAGDLAAVLVPGSVAAGLKAVAVTGTASVVQRGAQTQIQRIALRIADAEVRGQLDVTRASDRTQVEGAIAVTRLPVETMVAWLSRRAQSPVELATAAAQDALRARSTVWSRTPLDLGMLAAVDGRVRVLAGELLLPGGAALSGAQFVVLAAPGRIDVAELEGSGGGGRWTGGVGLKTRSEGGLSASVALRAADVELSNIIGAPPASRAVQGKFGGVLTLTGEGRSADDVVASLSGRGTLAVEATQVAALTPDDVAAAIDAAVRGPIDAQVMTLRQKLRETTAQSAPLSVPARAVAVEAKAGLLVATPVAAQTTNGQIRSTVSLDLPTLRVVGEWAVTASGAAMPAVDWAPTVTPAPNAGVSMARARPAFPPVIVAFTAPVAALGTATTTWASEALEREVAVRRVERDAELLETRRRDDAARAADDQERRGPTLSAPGDGPTMAAPPVPSVPTAPEAAPATAVSPATRVPRPAPPPKPANRPFTDEDRQRVFGGG